MKTVEMTVVIVLAVPDDVSASSLRIENYPEDFRIQDDKGQAVRVRGFENMGCLEVGK